MYKVHTLKSNNEPIEVEEIDCILVARKYFSFLKKKYMKIGFEEFLNTRSISTVVDDSGLTIECGFYEKMIYFNNVKASTNLMDKNECEILIVLTKEINLIKQTAGS